MSCWKIEFSGGGSTVYTAADKGKLFEYDIDSGDTVNDSRHGEHFVSALAVSGMGDLALGNAEGDVFLKRLEGEVVTCLTDHKKMIRSLQFSADGSKLILASDDLRISLFDL